MRGLFRACRSSLRLRFVIYLLLLLVLIFIAQAIVHYHAQSHHLDDNQNVFLAWPQGAGNETAIGGRNFTGFELFNKGSLNGTSPPATCIESLYQTVYCDSTLWEMRDATYHGTLGDEELTDSVCDLGCQRSLEHVYTAIVTQCGESDIIPGLPAISVVERLLWAYNDTCFKDVTTGRYCNDIIAMYNHTSDVSDMPEEQLCSYCFITKYQEMQQSAYSGYSQNTAQVLEKINSACSRSFPTTITEPFINVSPSKNNTVLDRISDNHYTTQVGDTWDSIAEAESISAATLYAINSALINYTSIPAGLSLCLPQTCETAKVQSSDTCISLGVENGASWRSIVDWNGALDYGCTNLVDPSPFWGETICIGAPGDPFEFKVGNGTVGQMPRTGYSGYDIVDPPADAVVAPNTTMNCGVWYTAESEYLTCEQITILYTVTADQFIAYNPSLEAGNCTASLQDGLTYCALATVDWDYEEEEDVIPWNEWVDAEFLMPVSTDESCGIETTCLGSGFGHCCVARRCWGLMEKCTAANCDASFGGCGEEYTSSNSAQADFIPRMQLTDEI